MSNGYNETSNHWANKQYSDPDVDLAENANKLGGYPADEYALKVWVNQVFENYVAQFNLDIDTKNTQLEQTLKAYIEASIRTQAGIDANTYALKTDLTALETRLRQEFQNYSNNNLNTAKNYTDTQIQNLNSTITASLTALNQYVNGQIGNVNSQIQSLNSQMQEVFTSVSNGKSNIAGAITDKGVVTSATDTFDTMASNIRRIEGGGGGGADLSKASSLIPDNIVYGKKAYGSNGLITGTHICDESGRTYPTYRNRYIRWNSNS